MRIILALVVGGIIVLGAWLLSQREQPVQETPIEQVEDTAEDLAARIKAVTGSLDGERIQQANSEPQNWLSHGRTYDEQRFSPLNQINSKA